ncbi:MAG: hypothetical protein ACKO32_03220 [Planctomycetia bacterium]
MTRVAITLSFFTILCCHATVAAQPILAAPLHPASSVQSSRFVQTGTSGAKLYNIADTKAAPVMSVESGALLRVKSENKDAGYLEVEPVEPVRVWVFGRFLETTEESGVLRVRGTGVNMRPNPSTSLDNNYPLSRSLTTGDRVTMIARNNPEKPLNEVWVQVHAPQGTTLWCKTSDTKDAPADASDNFATSQAAALRKAAPKKPVPAVSEKAAGEKAAAEKTGAKPETARNELAEADALYEAARQSQTQDFTAAKNAYSAYLAKNATGAGAEKARNQLERIALHEEVRRLKSDRTALESERQERLARAEAQLREASLANDPLWGRFQARGWLERSGETWVIRWAGKPSTELGCSNGRYDLSNYEGCQIGVIGAFVKSASGGAPARVDVRRIEVLDGRAGKP